MGRRFAEVLEKDSNGMDLEEAYVTRQTDIVTNSKC